MSRNFYILAAVLGLFALLSGGMSLIPSSFQPGLPANGTLWRTVSLIVLLASLAFALIGVMSNLFEQVDRRSEQSRQDARREAPGPPWTDLGPWGGSAGVLRTGRWKTPHEKARSAEELEWKLRDPSPQVSAHAHV